MSKCTTLSPKWTRYSLASFALLTSLSGTGAYASDTIFDFPKSGKVTETANAPLQFVRFWRTDKNQKDGPLVASGLVGTGGDIHTGGGVLHVPPSATFNLKADPKYPDIHQQLQTTTVPKSKSLSAAVSAEPVGTPLATSDLSIESVIFNSQTSEYELVDDFRTIAVLVGNKIPVEIPDLFADTNGDGEIGAGDILYSLVDLQQYLLNPPSFSLSDHFTIVDGTVAALPGMWFSATPFSFSPSGGFTSTSAFLPGGGFSGDAVVDGSHTLTSTPEPSSWALLVSGFGLAGWIMRRGRHAAERSRHAYD